MARRHNPEDTPDARRQAAAKQRAEQDRAERLAAQRKESHRKQQERIEGIRARRAEQQARDRQAAARGPGGRGASTAGTARHGQNEAAVYEYLKRHPEARVQEVAFNAIYGGGSVAWEGLHRKTRKNAEDTAVQVINRLKAEGKIKVVGHTLSGKPKYAAVGDTPTTDESGRPFYEKGRKGKVSGRDDPPPATDKGGGVGGLVFNTDSGGGDEGSSGGGLGGLVFGTDSGGGGDNDPGDDDGPRDGKLW